MIVLGIILTLLGLFLILTVIGFLPGVVLVCLGIFSVAVGALVKAANRT
jgi:hypothetical protein